MNFDKDTVVNALGKPNQGKYFHSYAPAYLVTNEGMQDAIKALRPLGAKVLTVAASGDQPLYFLLNGAKLVETFDVSFCAKVITDMKTAAVQSLKFEEYQNFLHFADIGKFYPLVWETETGYKLRENMPQLSVDFVNMLKKRDIGFLRCNSEHAVKNAQKTQEAYERLKGIVNRPFDFIWSDIKDITAQLQTSYDVIYLSNILQYCSDELRIDLVLRLFSRLNKGGRMMAYISLYTRIAGEKRNLEAFEKYPTMINNMKVRINSNVRNPFVILEKTR